MEAIIKRKGKRFPDFIGAITLAESLACIIDYYNTETAHGCDMLIIFTENEGRLICDSARPLLKNRRSSMTDIENSEELLLYKALEAAISAQLLSSTETMIPFFYVKSVEGNASKKRVGIIYHNFSSSIHIREGLDIHLYDPKLIMRIR